MATFDNEISKEISKEINKEMKENNDSNNKKIMHYTFNIYNNLFESRDKNLLFITSYGDIRHIR
jgi:hypothetical protein